MKVLPTLMVWIGMKSKNLNPNLIVPLTTVTNTYTEIPAKKIEETNLAMENSKKTKILLRNSEWGICYLTTNL